MKNCHCGEPAEVKWTVNGDESRHQEHEMCSNCMSRYWDTIKDNYKGSYAYEASTFRIINQ